MRFEIEPVGNSLVVKLYGEIDQHSTDEIRSDIDRAISIKNPATLIIDLGGVELMDSSGLGLIMGRYKLMAARGGRLMLVRPQPQVDKVLELSGIKKMLGRNCG
ncbi:MAG TPA: anti-sigma factor antagonist [Candidatus Monoglobus merdigallinarum]|uniref:Anti-sigma factor antagonist n=1 Tax=Candidatus Monoglobus merdigallinarum TaxID=2838698 RepID=A0A9D1TL60_9FIRM|nr:anti-sigma factor antagonist [Candidatus Monoglobus merdigallinarum]